MKPYLFIIIFFTSNFFAQTPAQPVNRSSFISKEVSFKSEGITLSGTVYLPGKPHACIVLVHGSGKELRMDGMASFLAENGIAVITYDKRGVGKSEGIYRGPEVGTNNIDSSNLTALALDANAAGSELKSHLRQKNLPLGLLGFSQAGWIIPIAASKNKQVNFMVIFSGPVVNTLEQLRFQFYTNGKTDFWDTHTQSEAREHVRNDPDRYQFAATDPVESLSKSSAKGLWLFGGKDIQIPIGLSIEHLDTLKSEGKIYEYKLFPDLGHNTSSFKSPEPILYALEWIKTVAGNKVKKLENK